MSRLSTGPAIADRDGRPPSPNGENGLMTREDVSTRTGDWSACISGSAPVWNAILHGPASRRYVNRTVGTRRAAAVAVEAEIFWKTMMSRRK